MNKIGFQNFRKFKDFPSLEYGGITFLVGRNNAGKSTFVKALLLIDNYLKSNSFERISFGNKILDDANIVTYGRALNNTAKKIEENYISFEFQIENYKIDIIFSGEEEDTSAYVLNLDIFDKDQGIIFKFDILSHSLSVIKNTGSDHLSIDLGISFDLENQIHSIKEELKNSNLKKTSIEYINLNSELDSLINKRNTLAHQSSLISNNPKQRFELSHDYAGLNSLSEIVYLAIKQLMLDYQLDFDKVQNGDIPSDRFEDLRALKELDPIFVESSFSHFTTLVNDFSIAYLGANPTKQSALFAIRDTNNALAQAIHEYKQLNILKGEEEQRFVIKWMQEFEVGEDFTILMHAGEAYELKILSNNNNIHLADKGMGSIQAMLLILRMACVIRKIKNAEKDVSNYRLVDKTTIIIEEPELNLHPALQSKITDLLFYTYEKYKIDFLIETHSEYMIRRSQVIVADQDLAISELSSNPFKAYYFHNESLPYALNYNADGTFDKNFGKGFFDEASGSTLELIKLKRQKSS